MVQYLAYHKDGMYKVAKFTGDPGGISSYKKLVEYVDDHCDQMVYDLKHVGPFASTYIRIWNFELKILGFYI